uniref:SPG21 abhydrolase domain containing, maspardin n=1 Tax=Bos indicus x Bos taurus TaxID=30522 RepID=A0A4W2HBT7_BOBOX
MGGICDRAKGKKNLVKKRQYTKTCSSKPVTQRSSLKALCRELQARQVPRVRRPFLPVPQPFPRCSRHMSDLELTLESLWASSRRPRPRQSGCQLCSRQDVRRKPESLSLCGPTRPVAMVTAGVTQLHPFLATWPHPSEPGSSRLAPAARTIPEEGGRRSGLARSRAPPLGGRPSSAPPRLAALTDTERSGLQPQPGPQQPPRPAPFLEGRAALGGGTGTWGRPRQVHLFGASLGGFLAQKFAEYTHKSPRVHSLILCNSFSDTSIFNQTWTASSFWLMPSFMLKKIVLGNFSSGPVDPMMADAIDFMVDRLESLGQSELASRLTLNCQNSYVEPHKIRDIPVTIMDVFDQSALSTEAKEEMYKLYPNARRAHLKTGGNFPYLCRSAEVNLYVQIHLLQFHGTKYAAIDPSMVSAEELEVQKGSLGISQEEQ